MDKGWTQVIRASGLIAVMTGDDAMRFDRGDGAVLAHAHRMADRTIDRHPEIATAWLRTIDIIQARQVNQGTSTGSNQDP